MRVLIALVSGLACVAGSAQRSPDLVLMAGFHRESLKGDLRSVLDELQREFPARRTMLFELEAVRGLIDSLVSVPTWLHLMLASGVHGGSRDLVTQVMRRGWSASSLFRSPDRVRVIIDIWKELCIEAPLRATACGPISESTWRLSEESIKRLIRRLAQREHDRLAKPDSNASILPFLAESEDAPSLLDTLGSPFYDVESDEPEDELLSVVPEHEVPRPNDWRVDLIDLYINDMNMPLTDVLRRLPPSVSQSQAEAFRHDLRAHTKFPVWAHDAIHDFEGVISANSPELICALKAAAPNEGAALGVDDPRFRGVLSAWISFCIAPLLKEHSPLPCVQSSDREYRLSEQQAAKFLAAAREAIINQEQL